MHPPPYMMTPKEIYRYAATMLQPRYTLLQVLFYAAGPAMARLRFQDHGVYLQLCSIFAACSRLRDVPSDQVVCTALTALCPEPWTLEQQLNDSFAAQLPKAVKHRRWPLAIDLHLRPYHGQAHRRVEELYRSQAKRGTTHFHAYATYYIVKNTLPVSHARDLPRA
jgi:hypothetical protein